MYSLKALKVFEAAARLGSFKAAASELCVTPTAVSHQVRQLEDDLKLSLFHRQARKVVLTEVGKELFSVVNQSFGAIDEVINKLTRQSNLQVDVALGPMLAARWLIPQMADFWAQHHHIDLRMYHTAFMLDPLQHEADIILAWGQGDWPGVQAEKLFVPRLTPVVSPLLLQQRPPLTSIQDLRHYPLIQHRDGQDWAHWFEHFNIPTSHVEKRVIEDANVALQAAIAGQGVGLGLVDFVEDDIKAGRLIRPFEETIEPRRAYYAICKQASLQKPQVRQVYEWLLGEPA